MSKFALFHAVDAADKAWMFEVVRIFGDADAGRARSRGRAAGEHGSRLREPYDGYLAASAAYRFYRC